MFSFIQVVAILGAICSLQIGISNYCFSNLRLHERSGFTVASLLWLVFVFSQNYSFFLAGVILFTVSIALQFKSRRTRTI
jgi:hypothetical protein